LRRLTLTSAVVDTRECLDQRLLDALCPATDLPAQSIAAAKRLAAQPGFRAVKRQIRGELAARLERLAATGQDPFLAVFG